MVKHFLYTNSEFNYILKRIGLNIAVQRKIKGLTQEQLAELTGISRVYIAKMESTKALPQMSIEKLYRIVKALDITFDDLFEGIDK